MSNIADRPDRRSGHSRRLMQGRRRGGHRRSVGIATAALVTALIIAGSTGSVGATTSSGDHTVITAASSSPVSGTDFALNRPPVAIENCRGNAVWPACLYGLTPQHLGSPSTVPAETGSLVRSSDRTLTMGLLLVAMIGSLSLVLVFFRHLKASVEPKTQKRRRTPLN